MSQTRVAGRDVDHEDRPARVAHLAGERIQTRLEHVLRLLAGRAPRRDVRPPRGQELEVARDVDHPPVDVLGECALVVQDRVDAEVVVVSRDQVKRHGAVAQSLIREIHPRADPLVHQLVKQAVAGLRIVRQPLGLVRRRDERVEADIGDVALEHGQLLIASGPPSDAEELGLVLPAVAHDRNDRLACEVAGDERDIGLVHVQLDRVQELPPGLLSRVEVAREVDPHAGLVRRDLGEEHVRVDARGP